MIPGLASSNPVYHPILFGLQIKHRLPEILADMLGCLFAGGK